MSVSVEQNLQTVHEQLLAWLQAQYVEAGQRWEMTFYAKRPLQGQEAFQLRNFWDEHFTVRSLMSGSLKIENGEVQPYEGDLPAQGEIGDYEIQMSGIFLTPGAALPNLVRLFTALGLMDVGWRIKSAFVGPETTEDNNSSFGGLARFVGGGLLSIKWLWIVVLIVLYYALKKG